jgi:hypothetical protein
MELGLTEARTREIVSAAVLRSRSTLSAALRRRASHCVETSPTALSSSRPEYWLIVHVM